MSKQISEGQSLASQNTTRDNSTFHRFRQGNPSEKCRDSRPPREPPSRPAEFKGSDNATRIILGEQLLEPRSGLEREYDFRHAGNWMSEVRNQGRVHLMIRSPGVHDPDFVVLRFPLMNRSAYRRHSTAEAAEVVRIRADRLL
jgi:hypothetical protein